MSNEKKNAFTLIEVLVVIAIMGIVTTIMIVSLSGARVAKDVARASQSVASNIRLADNYALTGKTADISEKVCEYQIQFVSTTAYRLQSLVRDASGNCVTLHVLESYTVDAGVRLGMSPGVVAFRPPRGETNLTAPLSIKISKPPAVSFVCIYPSGRVEENTNNPTCL